MRHAHARTEREPPAVPSAGRQGRGRMTVTGHRLLIGDARDLGFLPSGSVALVVTSPPYPMIGMWDGPFAARSPAIAAALEAGEGPEAFRLMHEQLDPVWAGLHRVLADGGIACLNVGDATRTVGGRFRLYPNHARVLQACLALGFDSLPLILWRKTTNAPNKFMGSGMLPAGAYVTLEHEYILVLRKGGRREFRTPAERLARQRSALFWEERNAWFSDRWELAGARQELNHRDLRALRSGLRNRSAAFPFELAWRLIHMYSLQGDTVLDPFAGTGTTLRAAMAACRSSVGMEIDPGFAAPFEEGLAGAAPRFNALLEERLAAHRRFAEAREAARGPLRHRNRPYGFPVVTGQERELFLPPVRALRGEGRGAGAWSTTARPAEPARPFLIPPPPLAAPPRPLRNFPQRKVRPGGREKWPTSCAGNATGTRWTCSTRCAAASTPSSGGARPCAAAGTCRWTSARTRTSTSWRRTSRG